MYDQYADIVNKYAAMYGVPSTWINAVIGTESDGNPNAFRQETNDASYGLMQLLYGTAQGLGYTGDPTGLYDPDTNINYGTKLLSQLIAQCGNDAEAVYSAYNSGGCSNYQTNPTVMAHVQRFLTYLADAQADDSGLSSTVVDSASIGIAVIIGIALYLWLMKGR